MLTASETINAYEAIRLFREMMYIDAQKRILCLTGSGKIGKSHLLTNVFPVLASQDYQARYALLDLSTPFSSVQDMLNQLCIQLGAQDFHAYNTAVQELTRRSQVDEERLLTTVAQITVADKDYQGVIYNNARYLSAQFIKDAATQRTDQQILLLFDNVREASNEMQWWFMKIFLYSTSRLKHLRVVFAGRSVPEPDDSYQEFFQSYQLRPVTYIREYIVYCQNNKLTLSEKTIQTLVPHLDYIPGLFIDVLPHFTMRSDTADTTQSDSAFIEKLTVTEDITETAANIAEACLSTLSEKVASIARYCVLFHWFDQMLIEALWKSAYNGEFDADQLYEQLRALPFIETLPWGLRFQSLTRAGLLRRYKRTQPELLKQAAERAVSAYEPRREAKKIATELLFCSIIAGDSNASIQLLQKLQKRAYVQSDWLYLRDLLALQEEAESFSFVHPLPRNEDSWLLRGLVSQLQGKPVEAIASYTRAIKMNKKNALTYVRRGSAYAERQQLRKALADYKRALRLAPDMAVAYACRGKIFIQKGDNASALKNFNEAIQRNPDDPMLPYCKGTVLYKRGDNQEALTAFDEALHLDPYNAAVYRDRGTLLSMQGKYRAALTAFDAAVDLDPYYTDDVSQSEGKSVSAIRRQALISAAYAETVFLAPKNAIGQNGSDSVAKKKIESAD